MLVSPHPPLQDSVAVWSGKQITVYELAGASLHSIGETLKDTLQFLSMWLFQTLL